MLLVEETIITSLVQAARKCLSKFLKQAPYLISLKNLFRLSIQISPCLPLIFFITQVLTGLNVYDILEPCFHNPYKEEDSNGNKSLIPSSFRQLGLTERPLPVRKRMFGRAWPFQAPVRDGTVQLWPQLISNFEVQCTVSLA